LPFGIFRHLNQNTEKNNTFFVC